MMKPPSTPPRASEFIRARLNFQQVCALHSTHCSWNREELQPTRLKLEAQVGFIGMSFHHWLMMGDVISRQLITMEMSLEAMKAQLSDMGISADGCVEKEDCLARLLEFKAALDRNAATAPSASGGSVAAEPLQEGVLGGRVVDGHGVNVGALRCPRCAARLVSKKATLVERCEENPGTFYIYLSVSIYLSICLYFLTMLPYQSIYISILLDYSSICMYVIYVYMHI